MYDNIGGKIKGLAKATFIVEAIAAIIVGIVLLVEEEWWCTLILFCGPIVAWVSSWLLYGFGEIIDKLCDIEHNTAMIMKPSELKKARNHHESEAKKAETATRELKKQKEAIAEDEKAKREAAIEREIANIEYVDIKYVDIKCPNCHEKLSFEKGTFEAQCPFCDFKFIIDE